MTRLLLAILTIAVGASTAPAGQVPDALSGTWAVVPDDYQIAGWDWFRTATQIVHPPMTDGGSSARSLSDDDVRLAESVQVANIRADYDRWTAENKNSDEYYFELAPRLHARARILRIDLGFVRVVIERDGVAIEYQTSAKKQPAAHIGADAQAKTWREGTALHQELTGKYGFKARQIFTPSADGNQLSVVTTVVSPRFKPALETRRTYRRGPLVF